LLEARLGVAGCVADGSVSTHWPPSCTYHLPLSAPIINQRPCASLTLSSLSKTSNCSCVSCPEAFSPLRRTYSSSECLIMFCINLPRPRYSVPGAAEPTSKPSLQTKISVFHVTEGIGPYRSPLLRLGLYTNSQRKSTRRCLARQVGWFRCLRSLRCQD
jgi:hypothetical protein